MAIKERSLFWMAFLSVITLGIYQFYWTIRTKNEMKSLGADIPTAFLMLIPFANYYFWYKYATAFTEHVKKGSNVLAYFFVSLIPFLFVLLSKNAENYSVISKELIVDVILRFFTYIELSFVAMLVFQMEFNKYARDGRRNAH